MDHCEFEIFLQSREGSVLETAKLQCLSIARRLSRNHVWTHDGFHISGTGSGGSLLRLSGSVVIGSQFTSSADDERLLVKILLEISLHYGGCCLIRVRDGDGQFLLIELADLLFDGDLAGLYSEWLRPDSIENGYRVLLHSGQLCLFGPAVLPLSGFDQESDWKSQIPLIFQLIDSPQVVSDLYTCSTDIQLALCDRYLDVVLDPMHLTNLILPRQLASLLQKYPQFISLALNAFNGRYSLGLTNHSLNAILDGIFDAGSSVVFTCHIPRLHYAILSQFTLSSQKSTDSDAVQNIHDFVPGKSWLAVPQLKEIWMHRERYPKQYKWLLHGCKVSAGFHILHHIFTRDKDDCCLLDVLNGKGYGFDPKQVFTDELKLTDVQGILQLGSPAAVKFESEIKMYNETLREQYDDVIDNDDWMNVSEEEVARMINDRVYSKKYSGLNEFAHDDSNLSFKYEEVEEMIRTVPGKFDEFLSGDADYEGVDFDNGDSPECSDSDADDDDIGDDFNVDEFKHMLAEMEAEFRSKVNDETPANSGEFAFLKNVLMSHSEALVEDNLQSGPAQTLLNSMGLVIPRNDDSLSEEDEF